MGRNKKAVIFGSAGQDGYYLAKLLLENNIDVITSSRSSGHHIGKVDDFSFVKNIIRHYQPDFIFNFAANSSTQHSFIFENHDTITKGVLNILETVYQFSPKSKIFLSGSGLQFVNCGLPIMETDPFEARDVYSIARIHSVYAARYFRTKGLKIYIGYFFNHDSPQRGEKHVNQKIVKAVNEILQNRQNIIELGDISVQKEFSFAQDIVEAVWLFINNENFFEAVLGSGRAYTIEYWLDTCFGYYNLDWKMYTKINPLFTPEYKILVSNPKTIQSLGWATKTSIEQLAIKMLQNCDQNGKTL